MNNILNLNRKLLSIHTVDRDITKYPNSNQFGIHLSNGYQNIQSMRLIDYNISKPYNYSNNYNNTKLTFEYIDIRDESLGDFNIHIPSGNYDKIMLINTIQNMMNDKIYNKTYGIAYIEDSTTTGIRPMIFRYNTLTNKYEFGCKQGTFIFKFNIHEQYDNKLNIYDNNHYWGLGYFLGFDKLEYKSSDNIFDTSDDTTGTIYERINQKGINIVYESDGTTWLIPDGTYLNEDDDDDATDNTAASIIYTPNVIHDRNDMPIYIELDKVNTIDEKYPYSINTNNAYNNDSCDNINSAFAKILPNKNDNGYTNDTYTTNLSYYHTTINHFKKLYFKFRYHDDILVDFNNKNFDFTIEINMIQDKYNDSNNISYPKLLNI